MNHQEHYNMQYFLLPYYTDCQVWTCDKYYEPLPLRLTRKKAKYLYKNILKENFWTVAQM